MEVKVKMADDGALYLKVAGLCKKFSIGQTTARALVHEMQQDKKWKKGVVAHGRMLLIRQDAFEAFLLSKSY